MFSLWPSDTRETAQAEINEIMSLANSFGPVSVTPNFLGYVTPQSNPQRPLRSDYISVIIGDAETLRPSELISHWVGSAILSLLTFVGVNSGDATHSTRFRLR